MLRLGGCAKVTWLKLNAIVIVIKITNWRLIMWRITQFIVLLCSIALNVYLFLKLNEQVFENTLLASQTKTLVADSPSENITLTVNYDEQPLTEKINHALKDDDYFLASFLIKSLENTKQLADLKSYWLNRTKTLINNGQLNAADKAITAYLEFNRDDIDFLYLQVEKTLKQQLVLTAIEYAYDIQYHVFTENQKREVIDTARQMVYEHADIFIRNDQWLELQSFLEHLMIIDVENLQLNWLYTLSQYHLGEFELAQSTIEPLLIAPNYKIKANGLLTKIQRALREPESIQLTKQGEHFIVQATINDSLTVSLMIDTGASISLLSEQAFAEVEQYTQVNYLQDITLNTAGGVVTASIYQAESLSIQGYLVSDFVFAVSEHVGSSNDGLLGMNYLRAFEFTIDQRNNLLILKNK